MDLIYKNCGTLIKTRIKFESAKKCSVASDDMKIDCDLSNLYLRVILKQNVLRSSTFYPHRMFWEHTADSFTICNNTMPGSIFQ